jgi:hypothetical protein
MIYEPTNRIEVTTPKGDGTVWYLIDYGYESDTVYTIIINATGELWQFTNRQIRVKSNITFNRNGKGQELDSESSKS